MAKIVSISIRDEDAWVWDALRCQPGSTSALLISLAKEYLTTLGIGETMARPDWYVEGADYSHLSVDEREMLRKFGYNGQ
jgi:hypothetical protein